jgi:DNA-directed RNA polymerase sigma subunit (sigma70/sigma32)
MRVDLLASLEALPLEELVREASVPPLDSGTAARLAGRSAAGDLEAYEGLVRAHLRVAVDEAIAHRSSGAPLGSLIRQALDSLLAAAREHDPATHAPFASHARARVRRDLRAYLFPGSATH